MDAIRVECETCNGTGKAPKEWDFPSGRAVAFGICSACLGQGWVLANKPVARLLVAS